MRKFASIIPVCVLCLTACGCFPYHYTNRPGLAGTVVSAQGDVPLAGAGISFGTNTTALAFSSADGSFYVPPKRRWGIWIIPQDVFPLHWTASVSHSGYETSHREFSFLCSATGKAATEQLGVISLNPYPQ
jgi:hypothetical protein